MIFDIISQEVLTSYFKTKPEKYSPEIEYLVDEINDVLDAIEFQKSLKNPNTIQYYTAFQQSFSKFKKHLLQFSATSNHQLTLEAANNILQFSGSYLRTELLVKLKQCLEKEEWLSLFFEYWPKIEIADDYIDELKGIFTNENMPEIMEKYSLVKNLESYNQLPECITVYRGCSTNTINGLSWTTDFNKAKFFAKRRFDLFSKDSIMIIRLLSDTHSIEEQEKILNLPFEETFIAYATVKKSDCLFFNDRSESELFCINPNVIRTVVFENSESIMKCKITE